MFATIYIDVYVNIYVSEAAISQIVAIRFCTLEHVYMCLNPCPTFSVSGLRAAVCRIPAHSCSSYSSIAFAPLFFLESIYHQIAFETWSLKDDFLALVKTKRVKPCLRQGASSGALRGRLRRAPLTSRGGGQGSRRSSDHQCTGRVQCTGI